MRIPRRVDLPWIQTRTLQSGSWGSSRVKVGQCRVGGLAWVDVGGRLIGFFSPLQTRLTRCDQNGGYGRITSAVDRVCNLQHGCVAGYDRSDGLRPDRASGSGSRSDAGRTVPRHCVRVLVSPGGGWVRSFLCCFLPCGSHSTLRVMPGLAVSLREYDLEWRGGGPAEPAS